MARILVVDDELDILTVMSMLLTLEGFEIETASNGRHALQLIHERPVDLVLTDWMMPHLDGVELCRQLRADVRTGSIPIILNSAAGRPPYPNIENLFDAFLPKPCSIDHLLNTLRLFVKD